uniref:Uncharacterized protein n=1 Tax=Timema tahoe TaxID=61484 RepID=A0A7R9IE61_9NEOP|nr:unnamed protein product [Timema tahoe]
MTPGPGNRTRDFRLCMAMLKQGAMQESFRTQDTPGRPTGRHLGTAGAASRGHDAHLQVEVEQDQFDSKSIELLQQHTRHEASGVGIKQLLP